MNNSCRYLETELLYPVPELEMQRGEKYTLLNPTDTVFIVPKSTEIWNIDNSFDPCFISQRLVVGRKHCYLNKNEFELLGVHLN